MVNSSKENQRICGKALIESLPGQGEKQWLAAVFDRIRGAEGWIILAKVGAGDRDLVLNMRGKDYDLAAYLASVMLQSPAFADIIEMAQECTEHERSWRTLQEKVARNLDRLSAKSTKAKSSKVIVNHKQKPNKEDLCS